MRAEGINRRSIGQLRQHTPACERGGDVIGNSLIAGEIWRALSGDDCGELGIGKSIMFGDRDMGIDFIARMPSMSDTPSPSISARE
jgi:hypothetical protein